MPSDREIRDGLEKELARRYPERFTPGETPDLLEILRDVLSELNERAREARAVGPTFPECIGPRSSEVWERAAKALAESQRPRRPTDGGAGD